MKRQKLFIRPKLDDCNGDLTKQWFIYYSVPDSQRPGKLNRKKDYKGLNLPTAIERYVIAEKKISEINKKLDQGWNPFFDDSIAVFADQLQYSHLADIYNNKITSNKTVRYYASQFLEKMTGLDVEGTIPTYRSKLRVFTHWIEARGYSQYDITAITNDVIIDFFMFLIETRKLSNNSIRKYRHILHALFEFILKNNKQLYQTPVYDIPKSQYINEAAPEPIRKHDRELLLEAMSSDQQLTLFAKFEYYCMIRPKELRFTKIGDIDFYAGRIDISRLRSKTNMQRKPIIPDVFLQELIDVYKLNSYADGLYVFGSNHQPGPQPVGKNTLRYRFNIIRDQLKLTKSYTLYSWKHTGVVEADMAGVSMRHIQHQCGHVFLSTTETYSRKKRGFVSEEIKLNFPKI